MKTVGLLFLSFVLTLAGFEPALACWCARKTLYTEQEFTAAVAEAYRFSSAVFSGEVIEKNRTQIKLKVAKVWKGAVAEEVMLSSEYYVKKNGETFIEVCAYSSFEIGKSYLIYAGLFENQLQVHECSRTQFLNRAARDIKRLDKLGAHHHLDSSVGYFIQWRNPTMACSGPALSMSLMQGLKLAAVRARR
jgi:hypothetical protein